MSKRIQWHTETRKVSDLKPYRKNPRIIDEMGLSELGKSFDEVGNFQPIAINTDNTILSGHARHLRLMHEDKDQEVLVMVPDRLLTPKQEEALIIRANKNISGRWDYDSLANNFELDDLANWGFTDADLSLITQDVNLEMLDTDEEDAINESECLECPKCGYLLEQKK